MKTNRKNSDYVAFPHYKINEKAFDRYEVYAVEHCLV